jgi:hypothetical protein
MANALGVPGMMRRGFYRQGGIVARRPRVEDGGAIAGACDYGRQPDVAKNYRKGLAVGLRDVSRRG